ncbi:MAG TPA: hypothetical protein VL371_03430, partial [Gemmataceae bacterium]|nr:hypothetical protein [Gemmataceae bacterium]
MPSLFVLWRSHSLLTSASIARWANPQDSALTGNVCYTVSPGQANVLVGRRDGRVFLLDAQA